MILLLPRNGTFSCKYVGGSVLSVDLVNFPIGQIDKSNSIQSMKHLFLSHISVKQRSVIVPQNLPNYLSSRNISFTIQNTDKNKTIIHMWCNWRICSSNVSLSLIQTMKLVVNFAVLHLTVITVTRLLLLSFVVFRLVFH